MVKEKKPLAKSLKKNPWIISTAVLAVAIVVILILGVGASGKVISEDKAKNLVQGFVDSQVSGAEVSSVSREGNFYKADVSVQGQNVPVYLTLDGKSIVVNVIPLDEVQAPSDSGSNQQQAPQEVVKSDKPEVELFVMSYCPYGTQEMKGIIPAVRALGDSIDFKLRFVNYAMHGEKEVKENVELYCIQEEQQPKLLDYLECYLGGTSGTDSEIEACRKQVGIDEDMLSSCVDKAYKDYDIQAQVDSGDTYPKFLIDDALNKKYGVQGSPTLVINGAQVSSARDSASLGEVICQAFNNAPEECGSLNLSSASPSPGFGYSTTTSGSTAQCS